VPTTFQCCILILACLSPFVLMIFKDLANEQMYGSKNILFGLIRFINFMPSYT
jgi:hypothetical protein